MMYKKMICRSAIILLFTLSSLTTAVSAERPPADYTEPITGMEFVAIPGGTYIMGDDTDQWATPEHEVTVKPFMLGRFEVTFEQYVKFCASTGRSIPSDSGWGLANRPVINLTWQDAIDFTQWLSEKTGKKFRLPSEAEWEYAARGGTKTKFPWGDKIDKNKANCKGCGSEWDGRMTAPVGSFSPNGFGLFDIIGNVYEWCLDPFHNDYVGHPIDGSAWTADAVSTDRINRGGSWRWPPEEMGITRRCWNRADTKRDEIGFRVLMEK